MDNEAELIQQTNKKNLNAFEKIIENKQMNVISTNTHNQKYLPPTTDNNPSKRFQDLLSKQSINSFFEIQVRKVPNNIAIEIDDEFLTYKELNGKANQLAQHLQTCGIREGDLIAVVLERSIDFIISILAIIKTGGAYIPINPSYPDERVGYMLKDAQVNCIITHSKHTLPLTHSAKKIIYVDRAHKLYSNQNRPVKPVTTQDGLAYIMYTSGSTGKPKGVMVTHKGIIRLVKKTNYINITPDDRIGHISNVSFDAATFEIWGALLNGASLILTSAEIVSSFNCLAKHIYNENISHLFLTKSLFDRLVLETDINFSRIKTLIIGGESLNSMTVNKLLSNKDISPKQLLNAYGPTENTTFSTTYLITNIPPNAKTIPIGKAISNTTTYILDDSLEPVQPGCKGELYLGGDGVALGYLNNLQLTAEKFINNPFIPGGILYKTGDIVSELPDGNIDFFGRMDDQVKIRGFRIELGEIEASLRNHSLIQHVTVLVEDSADEKQIVAYLVFKTNSHTLDSLLSIIRSFLTNSLPQYMIPNLIVPIDEMPITANGKVDKNALQQMKTLHLKLKSNTIAPRNEVEQILSKIWCSAFNDNIETIGVFDNFFELGGHSLIAAKIIMQAQQIFAITLGIDVIFNSLNIAVMAERITLLLDTEKHLKFEVQGTNYRGDTPLSCHQEQIWLHQQIAGDYAIYNEPLSITIHEAINIEAMEKAINYMLMRHEIFRMNVEVCNSRILQHYKPYKSFKLPILDVTHLPLEIRLNKALAYATRVAKKPFDLTKDNLIRFLLVQLQKNQFKLFIIAHHLIIDGVSIYQIFLPELEAAYKSFTSNSKPILKEIKAQYKDYVICYNNYFKNIDLNPQITFWKNKLANYRNLNFVTGKNRVISNNYLGDRQCIYFPQVIVTQLKSLGKNNNCTLFMVLFAAFNILLHRYTQQDDILVGTVSAGRHCNGAENIIGNFLNTIIIRNDLSKIKTFNELLLQVKDNILEAYANQNLPFQSIVKHALPNEKKNNLPFQVAFILEPSLQNHHSGWELSQLEVHTGTAKFDLMFELEERDGNIIGRVEYKTELFEASEIKNMIEAYEILLSNIVKDPNKEINNYELLSSQSRQMVLVDWNKTERDYDLDKTLIQLIEEQVAKTPKNIALSFGTESLTFQELNTKANQLAVYLRCFGVKPESLVVVSLERSLELVVTLLGIIKAGGAYLPIDPHYPQERISFMLSDANASIIISSSQYANKYKNTINSKSKLITIDIDWPKISSQPHENLSQCITPDNAVYVIYTSGSTGRPKGVINIHRGLINRLLWMQEQYQLKASDRVLQKTPFCFDVSVWEFFWPLLVGAELVIAPPESHKKPDELIQLIEDKAITVLHFVPSMLIQFLETIEYDQCQSLRLVFASGEALPLVTQKRFFNKLNAELHNLYGPTEAAIDVSYWKCTTDNSLSSIPIGKPIANTKLYILDKNLQSLPVGMAGELYIGGAGLARGYLNREQLTKERFIANPFHHPLNDESNCLYRTGDLARYLFDGNIEYLGRLDNQIKIKGFRIELGEIENALKKIIDVKDAAISVYEEGNNKILVAYIEHNHGDLNSKQQYKIILCIRTELSQHLPGYMIPEIYMFLNKLPLNANGKLDRNALPPPTKSRQVTNRYISPKNDVEKTIQKIWQDILNIKDVGINDNFFALGGDSMRAIQIITKLKASGFDVRVQDIYQYQTVIDMAKILNQKKSLNIKVKMSDNETEKRVIFDELYALSSMQEQIINQYRTQQIGSGIYHYQQLIKITDQSFCEDSFISALYCIVQFNPIFRTVFVKQNNDKWQQSITQNIDFIVNKFTCIGDKLAEKNYIEKLFITDRKNQFDVAKSPLFRFSVIKINNVNHFFMSIHHAIIDGWSNVEFLNQLKENYSKIKENQIPRANTNRNNIYKEFVELEHSLAPSMIAKMFWQSQINDMRYFTLNDKVVSSQLAINSISKSLVLADSMLSKITQLSQLLRVSVKAVLLSAYTDLLSILHNVNYISAGIVTNGRSERLSEPFKTMGLFWSLMPFSHEIIANKKLQIESIQEQLNQMEIHANYPVNSIMDITTNKPVYSSTFNYVNFHNLSQGKHTNLDFNVIKYHDRYNSFLNIALILNAQTDEIKIEINADMNCFEHNQVVNMLNSYQEFLYDYTRRIIIC